MTIPDAVPSLAELIDPGYSGNQCCWNNQKRGRKEPDRCGNIVRREDVVERKGLIRDLRVLVRSTGEPATLSPATPESIPEIQNILEKVSMWLLCKGRHRSEYKKIVRKWSDELSNVEEAIIPPTMMNIRAKLNIQDCERLFCHGKKRGGAGCSKPISAQNSDRADDIIADLAKIRVISSATKEKVMLLAQLLMCQGYHQDQAAKKSEEWLKKLQELLEETDAASEQPFSAPPPPPPPSPPPSTPQPSSTPPYNRATTADSERSRSTAPSIFSRAGSTATSTSSISPPSRREDSPAVTSSGSPLPPRRKKTTANTDHVEPQQVVHVRRTRATSYVLSTPEPVPPKFKPFPPKSIKAVLARVYEKIKRPIIPREEDIGYIYGFQREGDSLIKIGYTCNMGLDLRIKSWNSKCHQQVKVVLSEALPHAAKVESLVHSILYRERRREILINGACNGGKGCSTVHEEWFDVPLERLRDIVDRCSRWIRTWPYEDGALKPIWVKRVDELYEAHSKRIDKLYETRSKPDIDIWQAWIDITALAEGTIVQETVKSDVKQETGTVITTTEITTGPDMPQGFRDVNLKYNEKIAEIKAEATEEEPLSEDPAMLQDLSLHIDDPFVAPIVTAVPA